MLVRSVIATLHDGDQHRPRSRAAQRRPPSRPARQRKYRHVLRGGAALLCLCPPATRTRRWPTRDRRSVTPAGVAMVPRSA